MKTKEEIQAAFDEIEARFVNMPKQKSFEVNASCGTVVCSEKPAATAEDIQWLHDRINFLREDYYRLSDEIWKHKMDGHLPKLEGAGQMKKALKALGLDEDYEVQKKVIYASTGLPAKTLFEVSHTKV